MDKGAKTNDVCGIVRGWGGVETYVVKRTSDEDELETGKKSENSQK